MTNIMKSQLYQLKKSKLVRAVFICILMLQFVFMDGEMDFLFSSDVTTGKFLAENGSLLVCISLMFALVITAEVCGADFLDKTSNYELMGGHLRKEVYFARSILSLGIGTLGALILNVLPLVCAVLLSGWGDDISAWDIIFRYMISIFPIFRIISEFIFFSFLVKNSYAAMVAGFVISIAGTGWAELFPNGCALFSGIGTLTKLFAIPYWNTYTLTGEKDIIVYHAALSAGDVAASVVSSVLFGVVFLLLGYWYFKKDDMN